MKFLRILRTFNKLKKKKIFQDFAIGRTVAIDYFTDVRDTIGLNLYFLVDEKGYSLLWQHLISKGYKPKGPRIVMEGIPVAMFPVSIHPIFEEALSKSKVIQIKDIRIKVFAPEYLIATKLMFFRRKDKMDICDLFKFEKININMLEDIVKRYTDEKNPLHQRLQEFLELYRQER